MLQSFRKRIKSLNKTQQNTLTAILILVIFCISFFLITLWNNSKKAPPVIVQEPVGTPMEELIKDLTAGEEVKNVPEEVIKGLSAPKEQEK